jgi:hypothetical protein
VPQIPNFNYNESSITFGPLGVMPGLVTVSVVLDPQRAQCNLEKAKQNDIVTLGQSRFDLPSVCYSSVL